MPVVAANAALPPAPVGQGFTVTPSDLSFILKQIKIAEAHVANTTSLTGPCGALLGTGPNQLASPLLSFGLRTVDGSCNNLQAGQQTFGAADQVFPRLSTPVFKAAQGRPADFFGLGDPGSASSSYTQKKGSVFDTEPRTISNLIVDQTSTNPAAIAAAGHPVRTQNATGVQPCTIDPDPLATPQVLGVPAGCTPSHQTLFIPNVTTDVGLSPPYNSLFTLFGQFFDHGVDQTVKGGGSVFVPLKADDPLIAGPDHILGTGCGTPTASATCADNLPANLRFMVLTRAQNQPGPDGVLGDVAPTTAGVGPCTSLNVPAGCDESADDIQNATNTDSPWVDQSQTYTSHPSHQVFLREYVNNTAGAPVSTGKLLGGPTGPTAGGMSSWARVKAQAASLLGLRLADTDVTNIPMLAADPYGKFIPGSAGLPQYVTGTGLVEGRLDDPATPAVDETVPVPANALHFDTPFLTDIAHNADPGRVGPCTTAIGVTPRVPTGCLSPDADTTASADFASQLPGTYDDEMLNAHFSCGDGRCNENIGLTTIHQVFHSEHDRLVADIEKTLTNDTSTSGVAALAEWKLAAGAGGWNGERIFQAARFVTEMEYQHLVFEEFARKVQPAINPFQPFAFTQTELNPAIKAEFAHAVYRFGHSMLTETISRRNEDQPGPDGLYGTPDDIRGSQNDISLLHGFLNPPEFTNSGIADPLNAGANVQLTSEQAAGSVIMGMSDQVGSELDEFVTETLRSNLLGLPLDLATINMARARSEGVAPLNVLRRDLFNATNDGQLTPYTNWVDFGQNIKHPESLINFVAAYGLHPTITGATTLAGKRTAARMIVSPDPLLGDVAPADAAAFMNSTGAWANTGTSSITGLDNIDLWVGGLAERTNLFGGLLGSTFNYVFEKQLTDLQNGDRFYYLTRTPGMNLRTQLEGNSFAELMMRNTNAHSLKADAFATADCKFQLKNLAGTAAGFATFGNTVANDATTECDETALLIRMPDGTIKYRAINTVNPSGINGQSVYNGTDGVDRIYGGNDNDTFWGGLGNDIINGGGGSDVVLGGEGNDIITDFAGDDILKGGPGNDAIDAGPGLDIILGGDGNDFTNGGANANVTFAGPGDDFIIAGQGADEVQGDGGNDWLEGGDQPDLLQGDSGNLFFLDDSQKPGHDIFIGQGGDDDYDMEGGDDIGVAGPGVEKVAGGSGYDWEIGLSDPQPQDADLALPIAPLGILQVGVRDRFNEVEALSGGNLNDTLRGDSIVPSARGGAGFIGCDVLDQQGLDRIPGLDALVPPLNVPADTVIAASVSKCPLLTAGTNVWGDGNILLGGAGSDVLEGRGGNDIIDGDKYLSVRLSVRTNAADPASEIGSASIENPGQSAMTSQYLRNSAGALTGPTLQQAVFAGTVDPGNIVAVREILTGTGGTDTAVFSGLQANYTVTTVDALGAPAVLGSAGSVTTVVNNVGADGTDTLTNVEVIQFADTATPGAPTAVTALGGIGAATVTWVAPLLNRVPQVVTGYSVEATNAATGIAQAFPAAGGATGLVVSGLTPGSYTFRVQAANAAATPQAGPWSLPSGAVTVTTNTPGAPTGVTALASPAAATVSWTPPVDNGGSPITGFSVEVQTAAGVVIAPLRTAGPGATSLVVTGLLNGTSYRFRVQATNAVGAGAFSALTLAVTPTAVVTVPGAPTIGTATAGALSATVNWTPPVSDGGSAITGYTVRVVDALGVQVGALQPAAAGTTSLVVTGLLNGTTYRFRVQAVNVAGSSALSGASNPVTPTAGVVVGTVPGAPIIRNAASGAAGGAVTATANWRPGTTGSSPITGYRVTAIPTVGASITSAVLTPAAVRDQSFEMTLPAGSYRFTVVAINATGTGVSSGQSNLVTAR